VLGGGPSPRNAGGAADVSLQRRTAQQEVSQPMHRGIAVAGAAGALLAGLAAPWSPAAAQGPKVLRVGTFAGIPGQYASIQAAVDAAGSGDWILVAPGDYHESPGTTGVRITTPGIHLRGMDRNGVIVDGTRPGAPGACSGDLAWQDFGATGSGRDGVVVLKTDGVSVENLTVCNYFGNLVWFNGGDGSGQIGLGAFHGAYLSATTTFFDAARPSASYGLFVSNSRGPGDLTHTYASNMSDSSYYVGACPDCNTTLDDAHAEFSNLGFSGTNAGGHLLIENSEWNDNRTGIAPNSMNNDDAPPPQDGACPGGAPGPLGTGSCTIIEHNNVHDNNNADVPGYSNPGLTDLGGGSSGPVGTGIYLVGDQNDTVLDNSVWNNDAWGIMVSDRPDNETAPPDSSCQGGDTVPTQEQSTCYFPAFGNEVAGNSLHDNGSWNNPTNGDLADITLAHDPGNCWHDNTRPDASAPSSDPPALQQTHASCGQANAGDLAGPGGAEEVCAVGLAPCPFANYPEGTKVTLQPMSPQPTMPNPCAGVPANPWCTRPATATAALVPASSGGATAVSAAAIGTPNTAAAPAAAGSGLAAAGALLGGTLLLPRRRRRRPTRG
jgi:hypothetical protein